MAKPAAAGGAAAAPDKKGKKKTFKKKERKHVPHGLCYVQASFNNTIVTITDMNGNARLPGIAQGHALCRPASRVERREHGSRSWSAQRGCARERSGIGAGIGSARAGSFGNRSTLDSRRDADSAQWMPSAEKTPRVSRPALGSRFKVAKFQGFKDLETFETFETLKH